MPSPATSTTGLDPNQVIENLSTTVRVGFEDTFENRAYGITQALVAEEDGNQTAYIETDAVGPNPPMEEWVGEVPENRDHRYYALRTPVKRYVKRLAVDRFDALYRGGLVKRNVDRFYREAANDLDRLAFNALMTSPYLLGIDGVRQFSASHPHVTTSAGAVTTYSNLGSDPLSRSAYESARQNAALVYNERGILMPRQFNAIGVGTRLVKRAKDIFEAQDRVVPIAAETGTESDSTHWAAAAANLGYNVWEGECAVIELPLIGDYSWMLFDSNNKPLRCVFNRRPELVEKTNMSDEERMNHDRFIWQVEGEWAYEPGDHFGCFLSAVASE